MSRKVSHSTEYQQFKITPYESVQTSGEREQMVWERQDVGCCRFRLFSPLEGYRNDKTQKPIADRSAYISIKADIARRTKGQLRLPSHIFVSLSSTATTWKRHFEDGNREA